jgi:tetrahydromethanopterin S-methyltransferase subunit G
MAAAHRTTQLERESLEAHVDLCAMRYEQLDTRLTNLENKVDDVHADILNGQKSLVKVIVGTAGTVITGIISIVIALLTK